MNSRRTCPTCEATPNGCDTAQLLAGRRCCTACPGEHDDGGVAPPILGPPDQDRRSPQTPHPAPSALRNAQRNDGGGRVESSPGGLSTAAPESLLSPLAGALSGETP